MFNFLSFAFEFIQLFNAVETHRQLTDPMAAVPDLD